MKMKFKRSLTIALMILLVGVIVFGSFARFTDRVTSNTLRLSTATFSKDGYTITREYNDIYYAAGDDVTVKVTEGNAKAEAVQSVVTISAAWVSPDTSRSPFGNANAADNATIQIDGTAVDYTVNADGTITFELPAHVMNASSKNNERNITFHIPESLKSTGSLNFTFDGVKFSQVTAMGGSGFSAEFSHDELNASSTLDFTAKVIWDFSAAQDKSVIGSLTGSNGNYGIQIEGSGAMYDWASGTASKQSNYKDSVTSVTIDDGISNIGSYAFDGFSKITSIVIPKDVTELGSMSFGHCGKLTDITFKEGAATDITFPAAGSSTGAFYVPSYLKTTFHFNGNADAKAYDWVSDNRMKVGITGATLAYEDVKVGETVDPQLNITPDNHDDYQSIRYEVISGSEYAEVDPDTGVVTGLKKGTATVKVTIVDANGETVTAQGTVNIFLDPPMLAAQDTWRNAALDANVLTSVTFVDSYTPTGTESASWDASDASVPGTVTAYLSADKTSLTIAGNGYGLIFANPDSSYAFAEFANATAINSTDLLDTKNVTNMEGMFYGDNGLTSLDVRSFNVSKVTNMTGMFADCGNLSTLDLSTHTATAKDGSGTYEAWNPKKVTTVESMFSVHGVLDRYMQSIDLSGWETDSLTNMKGMFINCASLTEVKGISDLNTSKVTDMDSLFWKASVLETIDISNWNTSSLVTGWRMFQYCPNLKSIDISNWDMSKMTDTREMFNYCTSLTELTLPATLSKIDANFASSCEKLTKITFLQPADMAVTLPTAGSSDGAFYLFDPYTETAPLGTKVITSNDTILNYGWVKDHRGYTITVGSATGGTVNAPSASINGKTVTLTPAASTGYAYNGATVSYTEGGTAKSIDLAADELTFTMPAANVTVTPKWISTSVAYTVNHWQQTVTGGTEQNSTNFVLAKTENLTGTSGSSISPAVLSYTGFTAPSKQTIAIAADGSTVVNYYYTRNSYTVTLNKGTGIASVSGAGTYKYGASVTINASVSSGYSWSKWSGTYSTTTQRYTFTMPANNVSVSAYAVSSSVAQAIYSATDNSLTFIKASLYKVGDTYNGKTVTAVYTGFETSRYNVYTEVPWYTYSESIKSVTFANIISPKYTDNWFYDFRNCTSFQVSNLYTSNVTSMRHTFRNAGADVYSLTITGLNSWNTSKVTDMQSMFLGVGRYATSLNIGNISGWNTSNVTNMQQMFSAAGYKCSSFTLDLSSWNVSKVTNARYFKESVESKIKSPAFAASATSLSLTPEPELPNDVTTGTAQTISAIPDFATLNESAAANAPEGTVLYGWLVDSGLAKEIVLLEDFEEVLHSVYDEIDDYELTITPLYQKVEDSETDTTEPTEAPEPTIEETEPTNPTEAAEATEPSEVTEPATESTLAAQTEPSEPAPSEVTEAAQASEPAETQATEPVIEVTVPLAA